MSIMLLSFKANYLRIRPQNRTTLQEKITCLFESSVPPYSSYSHKEEREDGKTIFLWQALNTSLTLYFLILM